VRSPPWSRDYLSWIVRGCPHRVTQLQRFEVQAEEVRRITGPPRWLAELHRGTRLLSWHESSANRRYPGVIDFQTPQAVG
jgi:hypothetical protein